MILNWMNLQQKQMLKNRIIPCLDVKKAKRLKNIEGIIVGKAIYDGDIKLEELAKEDA